MHKGNKYRLYLTPEWVFHIGRHVGEANENWKQLDKVKIDFDRKVDILYPALSKAKQKTIKTAKQGIAINDISKVSIESHTIEFSITYKSETYFCSIPIHYFHMILDKLSSSSITLPHNAIEEIYGETEETLDAETKKLYEEVHDYLEGLIITIK